MEPTAFLFLLSPGPEGGVQGCHLVVLLPGVGLDGRAVPGASRGQSGAAGPLGKVSPPGDLATLRFSLINVLSGDTYK